MNLGSEQVSETSSYKNLTPTKTISSDLLNLGTGGPRNIKGSATDALINIAESTSNGKLSAEGVAIIRNFIDSNSRGFVGSMPMICRGKNGCPFASACPLLLAGAAVPVGSMCPVEGAMVKVWVNKHLIALGIRDVDDPRNSFDMDMLYELAGQELIRWRCSVHLSDSPMLVENKQVSADIHGDPIFSDVINPVIDVLERAGRNVHKIREALVATRESQIKAGQIAKDGSIDAAEKVTEARRRLEERREKFNQLTEKVKDAEFTVTTPEDE